MDINRVDINEHNRSETSTEQIGNGLIATKTLKTKIIKDIIQPQYIADIKKKFSNRDRWNSTNNIFMLLSKISSGSSTVLSFISVYKQDTMYAFLAGVTSTFSSIFNVFEIGVSKKAKEQTNDINLLLKKLEIDDFPMLVEGHNDKNNNEEVDDEINENRTKYDKNNEIPISTMELVPETTKKTQKTKKNKKKQQTEIPDELNLLCPTSPRLEQN